MRILLKRIPLKKRKILMRTLEHEISFRGEELIKKMGSYPIVVCGAGAIGSNLIDNMVRQGFSKITVIDDDRVEDHNRQTQVYSKRDVGTLKVQALRGIIFNNMAVQIETQKLRLTDKTVSALLPKGSLVVDGFDNAQSRGIVTDYCKRNKIDCLHVGLFQNYAEAIWNEQYRLDGDSKGSDVCEYPLARNVILLAVSVATEVIIRFIATGKKEQYTITLGDFKIFGF